jgi:ATP-binding cassette subfamily C protein
VTVNPRVILIGLLITKSADQFTATKSSVTFLSLGRYLNSLSVTQIASAALILFLLKSILSAIFTRVTLAVLANSESKAASDVFQKMLVGGFKNFSDISSQKLIFSLNDSARSAINDTLAVTVTIISESALLIGISVLFLVVNFKVAIGVIIYFLIVGLAIHRLIGPRMQNLGNNLAKSAVSASTSLSDSVIAFREIFALQKQSEFLNQFSKGRINLAKSHAFAIFYASVPRYFVESALISGSFLLAIFLFKDGDPSTAAGTFSIFMTGSMRIMASMLPLQSSLGLLKNLNAHSESFVKLVKKVNAPGENSELPIPSANQQPKPISVKFQNVNFTYPKSESPVLKNINLSIDAGEYVALIGPSGAGKSTIADLLIKLIEPTSGEIIYEGPNPAEIRIGYVPQSPGIISGSILQNITMNVDSNVFDQSRIDNALKSSHLTNLISTLKDGVNTDLGAHSDGLSGGQMQRIGLARALYANPGILVLDEATSALDAETESAVSESLRSLKGACTIFVIAHRLSTVQNADRVYVIDDGQIVASGKFSELAKSNELVARYVELSQINID